MLGGLAYVFCYYLIKERILDFLTPEGFQDLADKYRLVFHKIENIEVKRPLMENEDYFVTFYLERTQKTRRGYPEAVTSFIAYNAKGKEAVTGLIYNVAADESLLK